MSNIGIIDIGSNSFNLIICNPYTKEKIYFEEIFVGIRKGTKNNIIHQKTISKSISTINYFKKKCTDFHCEKIYLIATASLRNALNRHDFIKTCKTESGLIINIISGSEEAKLIFESVNKNLNIAKDYLIIDIGGASTEFILVKKNHPLFQKSYAFGSQLLIQKFKPSSSIKNSEIKKIDLFFEKELHELTTLLNINNIKKIIGTSGSFECLSKIDLQGHKNPNNHHKINIKNYQKFIAPLILNSSIKEREKIPGLLKMRSENIIITIILINFLIKMGIKDLYTTNFSLKDGVFLKILNKNVTWKESLL